MVSIPTTVAKFREPKQCIVSCRVHRKSDQMYWGVKLLGYPSDITGTVQQIQAWACGLAVHPNFECVTFESIELTGKSIDDFDSVLPTIKTFLDEETSERQSNAT